MTCPPFLNSLGPRELGHLAYWSALSLAMGFQSWLVPWLVVEPYPSEKYESIGIMTFPINMESHKIHANQPLEI